MSHKNLCANYKKILYSVSYRSDMRLAISRVMVRWPHSISDRWLWRMPKLSVICVRVSSSLSRSPSSRLTGVESGCTFTHVLPILPLISKPARRTTAVSSAGAHFFKNALSLPGIVSHVKLICGLAVEPKFGAVAEKSGQAHCRVRAYSPFSGNDCLETALRHAGCDCQFCLAQSQRFHELFQEHFSRMNRVHAFSHFYFLNGNRQVQHQKRAHRAKQSKAANDHSHEYCIVPFGLPSKLQDGSTEESVSHSKILRCELFSVFSIPVWRFHKKKKGLCSHEKETLFACL